MKISLWITLGLIISAICVSSLGAYFSIIGLGALFSGAMLAVWMMAGSLELSKFILAAYIHQRWTEIGRTFKYYLMFAIVVLSAITSLGIFGFLSDAYQSASTAIQSEQIRLDTEKNKQILTKNEIERLNKAIEEVPDKRITKKMKLRADMEPVIADLTKKLQESEKLISDQNLKIVEIQKKVGPLIYISRSFNINIDTVVKYLILIFVTVFDPLAICLVIASSQALSSRTARPLTASTLASDRPSDPVLPEAVAATAPTEVITAASIAVPPPITSPKTPSPIVDPFADAEIIEMSFEDLAAQPAVTTAESKKTS